MIWKLMGGIFIVVCGTFGGMYMAATLRRKGEFLEQYIIFLTQADTMINYQAMPIGQILQSVRGLELVSPIFTETYQYLENGEPIETAWTKSANKYMQSLRFSQSDIEMVEMFGKTFGMADRDGELAEIRLHKTLVQERYKALKADILSQCRIYRITGMFFGVLAAVIFN